MAAIFKLSVMILCLFVGALCRAEEFQWSGLRIANAFGVAQQGMGVELNGRPWAKSLMKCGELSGLRRVVSGRHRLCFSQAGLKARELRLNLKPGQIVTLVVYAHPLPAAPGWEIRVLKLDGLRLGSSRSASVVDVGHQQRRLLEIKQLGKSWAPLALRRLELEHFNLSQHRGYLPMRVGRRALSSMPVFEHGHHVVVLYERKNGELHSIHYRDRSWPKAEEP